MGSPLRADGSWRVRRRIRYDRTTRVRDGLPQFGFQVGGDRFVVEFQAGYVGLVRAGRVVWTAGWTDPGTGLRHVPVPLHEPRFVGSAERPGQALLSDGRRVWRLDVETARFTVAAEVTEHGVVDPGNCVWLPGSGIWVNDIAGHQVVRLDEAGRVAQRVGDGTPGFQLGTVGLAEARFGGIYDLRAGPDGRLYVLDSTNHAVRVIDPGAGTVTTVCGDGVAGWRGDGGPAVAARLGGDRAAAFDGPWSLAVDDRGTVFVGDTHNRAVRRIDAVTGRITTVAAAGTLDGDGLFTLICGLDLDPGTGELYVPDWVGEEEDELVVLAPVPG